MRNWRKTALWLGLIGSASFLSLSAMAQTITAGSPDESQPILAQSPAESSFHDASAPSAPETDSTALQAIPLPEPAPVTLDTADLKPEPRNDTPKIDIPLPDAAPVTALMQQDVLRIAVE